MKKPLLLLLLSLVACAGGPSPNLVGQPSNAHTYQADLNTCQDWAAPTSHEWAARCEANGEMVMGSKIFAYLSGDDPRDHDAARQSMPNSTQYRLDMCMKEKGYKIEMPANPNAIASRY